ncbi:MAG: hypothetical protein ACREND_05365 [Gemmatimonadaceae bacterium]
MVDIPGNDQRQAVAKQRKAILALAKQQADEGAHYLWGAQGMRPSSTNSTAFAPVVLTKSTDASGPSIRDTTFCAATTSVGGLVSVCAGRCHDKRLAKGDITSILISAPEGDQSLGKFIDAYKDNTTAQYNWGFTRTPRKVRGNATDYTTSQALDGMIVWGEGCDDTRHFDCGGFIKWIVQQVCGVNVEGISQNPSRQNALGDPIGRFLQPGELVEPADILVYAGHIAFATGEPLASAPESLLYSTTQRYLVAQADSAVYGVNYGHLHDQTNQHCVRLSDSTLLGRK